MLACTVFQTEIAVISIIDEHDEVIKAENGFPFRFIDRADSIAAHVLLANEPMVILDTEQVRETWKLQPVPLADGS